MKLRRKLRLRPCAEIWTAVVAAAVFSACAGGSKPAHPAELPKPVEPVVPEKRPMRVQLSPEPQAATWIIESHADIETKTKDIGEQQSTQQNVQQSVQQSERQIGVQKDQQKLRQVAQQVDTRAQVSWRLNRSVDGSIRASGQVDSFTVTNSGISTGSTGLFLLDAVIDSVTNAVSLRPAPAPLSKCDKPEAEAGAGAGAAGAASVLAGSVLIRVPDGVAVGDTWRDSVSVELCISLVGSASSSSSNAPVNISTDVAPNASTNVSASVSITVVEVIESKLEKLDARELVVVRNRNAQLSGEGGSAFRKFEVAGSSVGLERVVIDSPSGLVRTLDRSSTLTLETTERRPNFVPIVMQVIQKAETKAKRVTR